ncbi:CYP3A4 [Branchiostoma lanceolatum]|uniref:CYP3A4 protein n=2 Tax=Branchiostoma lanceolatum TaxID=7740 RepID=A0A8S4MNB6_BRALA|nr:CYP3A4 [Branchiostoma lanceolatum]
MELDVLPIPLTWVLLAVLPVLFYLYAVRPMQALKKLGVSGPTPLPLIGNLHQIMKTGIYNMEAQVDAIATYGNVYGVFNGRVPILTISDPEMMREIFVKQFHKFTNRAPEGMALDVKPQARMLTQLVDEDWKNVRSTITPAFSGGKLKQMTEAMNSCADLLVGNIGKFGEKGESFDTKELTGAFTTDVIARTAFGLDVDSQRNPQDPFVVYSKKAFNFNFLNPLIWLFFLFPSIMKPILEKLNYNFVAKDVTDFFYNILEQIMGMRKNEQNHGRVDFMQLMMDAHRDGEADDDDSQETKVQGTKKPLTKDDIVANSFLFFLAGYETTATAMAFTLYNLALHQDAQDKAREEINQVMDNRELVDYEAVHNMPYLDMCINENLRMYSPAASNARVTGEEVKLKWLTIPKNTLVTIPILGIHHDPKRWPEPSKFIPERFTKEEREKRDPFDWQPFGAGPRNCIGMRLALMELKVGLAKVLMKYRIVTGPDTDIPLKIMKYKQFPTPENGIRLRAELLHPGSD